jgi:hypothetical protein
MLRIWRGLDGDAVAEQGEAARAFQGAAAGTPVLEHERTDAGADYYEMTQKASRVEILPGLKTEV